jgi:hypothetical protein
MSDTNSKKSLPTTMKPAISDSQFKKGYAGVTEYSTSVTADGAFGDFIVRVPRDQRSIAVKLNTRLLTEQREIEQANDAIRRTGR